MRLATVLFLCASVGCSDAFVEQHDNRWSSHEAQSSDNRSPTTTSSPCKDIVLSKDNARLIVVTVCSGTSTDTGDPPWEKLKHDPVNPDPDEKLNELVQDQVRENSR